MNFVELLYVILIYHISGNQPLTKEAKDIINAAPDKSSVLLSMTPYLGDVIEAMRQGKSVDIVALSIALKETIKQYQAGAASKASFADVLMTFAKWFNNQNAGAHAKLANLVSRCDSAWVRSMITQDAPDQKEVQKSIQSICNKMGFKGKSLLTQDESLAAKSAYPELYREYLALKRAHSMSWKTELSNYVKDSGSKLVSCQKALAHLAENGIEHSMPTGFTGMMDAEGNWYTKEGKMLGNVPKAPVFTTITMRTPKDGDVEWVCKANKPDGGFAYVYTKEHVETSWKKKYEVAKALIKNIKKFRAKWLANIQKPFKYEDATAVASVVIELLYLSSDRAGSKQGGSEGSQGFGMSSILCKHVTIRPNGEIFISYKGKDAVQFKFTLRPGDAKDKIICEAVARMVEGKGPRDPVFSREDKNGWKPVTYAMVSAYFKSITGGANIHKLRTIAGTDIFNKEVEALRAKLGGKKLNEKQALEAVLKMAMKVGKQLGHIKTDAQGNISTQPMTSLKNYIDFNAQVAFFESMDLPVPAYLEKMMATDNSIKSSLLVTAEDDSDNLVVPIKNDPDNNVLETDTGEKVDQTGGEQVKRTAVRFLEGEAQNRLDY